MCLSVIPQEIQPGDHHKALLGWKVSVWVCKCVCACLCVQHVRFPPQMFGLSNPQQASRWNIRLQLQSVTWDHTFWKMYRRTDMEDTLTNWQHGHVLTPSCFPSFCSSAFWTICQESYLLLLSSWSNLLSICISHIASVSKTLQARTEGRRSSLNTSTVFFWFSF